MLVKENTGYSCDDTWGVSIRKIKFSVSNKVVDAATNTYSGHERLALRLVRV